MSETVVNGSVEAYLAAAFFQKKGVVWLPFLAVRALL
jgi:hypothetical protein